MSLYIFFIFSFFSFCDKPYPFQMTTQDPATNAMEWMIDFYDLICFDLIIIVSIVLVLILTLLFCPIHFDTGYRYASKSFSHSTALEVFWTIVPAILLISIAYPSFNLLYALDEDFDYIHECIKIIGHQWYWTYEYHFEIYDVQYDSYMLDSTALDSIEYLTNENLELKPLTRLDREDVRRQRFMRLLDVDNRLPIPVNSNVVLLITSADVLHSWAVPSFGIKVDACPGRLTKTTLVVKRPGVYYGQCSEICGVNHGFMPIVVEGVVERGFRQYMYNARDRGISTIHRIHFMKTELLHKLYNRKNILIQHDFQRRVNRPFTYPSINIRHRLRNKRGYLVEPYTSGRF